MLEFQERKRALLTIMTTQDSQDENHALGSFNKDAVTSEMIHYTEGGKCSSLAVDCGVYLLSTKLFKDEEFMRCIKGQKATSNCDKDKRKSDLARL